MKESIEFIAFIPARGGSQGVPKKNIQVLHGRPLILHTIDFAETIEEFSKLIVSTDTYEIANVSARNMLDRDEFDSCPENSFISISEKLYIHKRPAHQAQTLSPIRDVLFELASQNELQLDLDLIMMLQPTSPYRRRSEIDEIISIIESKREFTSVVSINSVGGQHPDRMYRYNGDFLTSYINQNNLDNKPRQSLEELYIKDGAYYLLKKSLLKRGILLGDTMLPIFRSGLCTINIDTWTDFKIAELIQNPFQ